MWKDFFYFTKRERVGIYVLIAMIGIIVGIDLFLSARIEAGARDLTEQEKKELQDFLASVKEKKKSRKAKYQNGSGYEAPVILAPFDPNIVDSAAFVRLGLKPFIARNIIRYRAKGGKFRTPESFAKVYGITRQQFEVLLPYITISEQFRLKRDTLYAKIKTDTMNFFKYPTGTVIELNSADTTELKKIPGIGSGIARMIVGYRSRLGGFYKTEQLQELKYVPVELNKWFSVASSSIRKININKAGVERLTAHPYINFYQAKVITEYRKKKGLLKNLSQLALYEEFTKADLDRIFHYIEF